MSADRQFCEQCGTRLASVGRGTTTKSDPAQPAERVAGKTEEPEDALIWQYDMPLINNRFVMWDAFLVLAFALVAVQALLFAMGWIVNGKPMILPTTMWAAMAGVIVVLFLLTALVVFQNRFRFAYQITSEGVTVETGQRERKVNLLAKVVGIFMALSGRPGLLGAALLSESRQVEGISWRDVRKVTVHPRALMIALNNSWRVAFRIFCTSQNYETVVERVQAYAAEGRRWQIAHKRKGVRDWNRLIVWAGQSVVATIAAMAWREDLVPFALLAGVLVLASGMVEGLRRRGLALLATGAAGLLLGVVVVQALSVTIIVIARAYGYEDNTPLLVVTLCGTVWLLGMALVRLVVARPAAPSKGGR